MNFFYSRLTAKQAETSWTSSRATHQARLFAVALLLLGVGSFFSLSRAQSPVISGATSCTGTVGLPFAYDIMASNTPTSFNATGLPAGLLINTYTGVVWGTPTTVGPATITLTATNSSGTATAKLTVTISPQPLYPVITSATVAAARVGAIYNFIISATNSPTSYSATGLPAGLTLDTIHGVISGTPTTVGTFTATLGAINASGTGTSPLVLTVTNEIGKGADVGWLQQMDATGFQFYENSGQQLDPDQTTNCLKILRKRNIDSIRVRVFVPPQPAGWNNIVNGNCNIREVVGVAAKAQALGFRVSIDLCYCWSFADPGGQKIPIDWVNEANQAMANPPAGETAQQAGLQVLVSEVTKHTTEILTELKAAGVTPEWVQVGNEITNGILDQDGNAYPAPTTNVTYGGSTSNWPQLVQLVNAGYAAVKAVDPNIKVVIHIDRAHNDSLDKGFFSNLQKYGGKWDISGTDCDSGTLTDIATTVNDLAASFNQPGQGGDGVMMCEIEPPGVFDGNGNYAPNPNFDWMTGVINLMRAVPGNKGVLATYWEPEAEHDWDAGWPQSAWINHEPCSALDSMRPSILQTNGLNIVDGLGTPLQLKGVNLGGLMVMEPWMTPADASGLPDEYSIINELDTRFGVTEEQSLIQTYRQSWITSQDFDNIKAQGLNVIRVPVWWGDFYALSALGATNPTIRTDAFTVLDSIVETAAERGIRTIIDMHGVFGGQSVSDDTGYQNQNQYWTNANDQANTQQMWSAIAAHYRGNAWVAGYDLLNEPSGAPNSAAVVTQLNSLYTTVRAVDPNHVIFMEGTFGSPWGWKNLPSPSSQGWTNVVYEMHEYQFSNETVAGVETGADNQVADFNNHVSDNVPDYIGEFNAFGTGTAAWQYVVNDFNNANMSWSSWSYKATHGAAPDSWGLYDPTGTWTTVPNITTDSSSTISTDWSKWTTSNTFALNPMISGVLTGGTVSITSQPQATAGAGNPFTFQITALGTPTSYSATNLPSGLTLNSTTGIISGTPTDPGDPTHTTIQTSIIGLTVNYAGGASCTGALLMTIYPPGPVITSNLNQSATVGVAFNLYLSTGSELGGLEEISSPGTQLPPGLTISVPGNGLISGTPTTSGTFTAELAASNQWGVYGTPVTMTFTVHPPAGSPAINSAATATATVGNAFNYTITASNTPTSFTATPLPSGLSLNATSGAITGSPTATGIYTIAISATNSHGTANATLNLTVNPPPPSITSATAASGGVGGAFNYILAANNSPTSFSATGLPPGLTINTSTGIISGTPTASGTYVVTLTATNVGGTGTTTFTVTVNATSPSSLLWTGTTSLAWDVATANWTAGGTSTAYADDTLVTFDDTGTGGTVTLAGAYSPAGLTVNTSSKTYAFAGPGSLNGPMTLTKSGSSGLSLSGSNFYTGGTQLLAGQLSVSATAAALGTGPLIFGSSGDANTVTVRVAGLNLPNPISVYPGGTRWVEPGNGSAVTYNGAVTLNGGATLSLSTVGGNVTLGGGITGTGNILFGENGGSRANHEYLSGASINMVGTISDAGNPDTGGCSVSGSIGTNVTGITQGSTSDALTLTGTNPFNGPITITSGTLTLGGAGVVGNGSYTGAIANSGTFIYSSTATQALAGVISGAGSVDVNGGLLMLSGSNSYTGGTVINSGTLVVTGALASGAVSVSTGGSLSGKGTIGGATSISAGASLAPGSLGTGTLTLADGLQMASGSSLNFNFGTPGASCLVALTGGSYVPPASGQVTINISAPGGLTAGSYPLMTGASGISAATFTLSSVPSGNGFTYSLSASGGTLSLVVTPPPMVPTNLAARASGAGIVLSWTGSINATSYAIERSTVSGGPYTLLTTATATSFTDTSVAGGSTYYYVVSASDSAGTSSTSREASATALTAFQQWLATSGLPTDTTPSAQPDNDGLSLLMKYATGLAAGSPSAAGPTQIASSGDSLVLNFNRINPAPLNYLVETSSDLVHWTPLASLAAGASSWTGSATVTESGSNPVSVTVTDTASLSSATAPRFLRLRVTTATDTTEPGTVPMGDVPVTLAAGAITATSFPLDNAPVARNAVGALSASTLTVVNAGSWATTTASFALRLLSGNGSGCTFAITGQSGNALTLNAQGVDLTRLVAVGDIYEILPLNTLGSIYGTSAPLVQPGSSAASADNIQAWNGVTWLTYYNNGTTWKQSGSLLSQNNTVLPLGGGLLITRRGATALNYPLIGRVPEVTQNQFTNSGGTTFLGGAYPIATTLSATGFTASNGWQSGASAAAADNVLSWNGTTWLTFFFNGTNWKQSGSLLNQGSYPLAPGQPLMIQRRSSPAASNAFVPQPLNYTP